MSNNNQNEHTDDTNSNATSNINSKNSLIIGILSVVIVPIVVAIINSQSTIKVALAPIAATKTAEFKQTVLASTVMIEPIPFATNTFLPTSSITSTNISTAFPLCPNVKVENLEIIISTGKPKTFRPGQDGKFNLLLLREELGFMNRLKGHASLSNADDCSCKWEGNIDSNLPQTITGDDNCQFSIGFPNNQEQIKKIYLILTIGNNEPILFTIEIP